MQHWLSANDMIDKYHVSQTSLSVFASKNKNTIYVKKDGRSNYFNEKELLAFHEHKKMMWLKCHEFYYHFLLEKNLSGLQQGKMILEETNVGTLKSWSTYINSGLWASLIDTSILSIKYDSSYLKAYYEWGKRKLEHE